MRILTIVGARPQFIKAAMVSRAILVHNRCCGIPRIEEHIIHTGQHFDSNMSEVFFKELQIPEPAVNLHSGTGSHGEMTGRMLTQLEQEMIQRKPDWVLVYGDTNSTLAGALAATKLHIPVAHVEAGLRSFNRRMPEEVNRVLTDHIASLLFCPTQASIRNLNREGIIKQVHHVGDVMYDAALLFGELALRTSDILARLELDPGVFSLATVHRAENTDDPIRLLAILDALQSVEGTVVLPLHPRTKGKLPTDFLAKGASNLIITDPLPYLDMVMLEKHARVILTDSGGVQKEAYFHGVPCITLRDETEWVETLEAGWNQLAGADRHQISACLIRARKGQPIPDYGDGHSASLLVSLLASLQTNMAAYRPDINGANKGGP